MSIPTPFNPMGTLGAELPYVQPIMTSLTDWSNKTGPGAASFGLSMTSSPSVHRSHDAWYALNGASSSSYENGWMMASGKSGNTIITFNDSKTVKITRLEFYSQNDGRGFENYRLTVYSLGADGDWVQKGQITTNIPFGTSFGFNGFDLDEPVFSNKYKIIVDNASAFSHVMSMKLIGVYKP